MQSGGLMDYHIIQLFYYLCNAMDNLISHIEYLILVHDCVVIPTLGAFIATHEPAHISDEGILPPCRKISFNQDIRHEDALLAASYARKEGISLDEGRRYVKEIIRQLRYMLDADGEITIGRLGILCRQPEGNLIFTPISSPLSSASKIGREEASIKPLAAEPASKEKKIRDTTDDNTGYEKPADEERQISDSKYYIIRIHKQALKYAAMLMVVVTVLFSIAVPYTQSNRDIDKASVLPIDSMVESNQKKQITEEQPLTNIESTDSMRDEAEEISTTDEYHLIVGTFHSEREAEKFAEMFEGCTFSLRIIKSNKIWRISAKSDDNKESLLSTLNSEKFKREFKEGWIWHQTD